MRDHAASKPTFVKRFSQCLNWSFCGKRQFRQQSGHKNVYAVAVAANVGSEPILPSFCNAANVSFSQNIKTFRRTIGNTKRLLRFGLHGSGERVKNLSRGVLRDPCVIDQNSPLRARFQQEASQCFAVR